MAGLDPAIHAYEQLLVMPESSPGMTVFNLIGTLNRKNGRTRGLARLQVAMRLRRVAQRIGLVDRQLDDALLDDVEQFARGGQQILAAGRVGIEGRPGQEQRTLAGEDADINGADRTRGLAE